MTSRAVNGVTGSRPPKGIQNYQVAYRRDEPQDWKAQSLARLDEHM
ncbi:hypothetical protein K2X85_18085 [bacterium]|nr:hypothetical protein [bacterium]